MYLISEVFVILRIYSIPNKILNRGNYSRVLDRRRTSWKNFFEKIKREKIFQLFLLSKSTSEPNYTLSSGGALFYETIASTTKRYLCVQGVEIPHQNRVQFWIFSHSFLHINNNTARPVCSARTRSEQNDNGIHADNKWEKKCYGERYNDVNRKACSW